MINHHLLNRKTESVNHYSMDIRQAIDRCSNIWASLPGAGYGQYEHKIGDLIARFKEAGGVVNEVEL